MKTHDRVKFHSTGRFMSVIDMKGWRTQTPTELAEIRQKEFLGSEYWNARKRELDEMLSYRKSFKGKPTDFEIYMLEENKIWIAIYKGLLFGERT
jgi:hypothetical protein